MPTSEKMAMDLTGVALVPFQRIRCVSLHGAYLGPLGAATPLIYCGLYIQIDSPEPGRGVERYHDLRALTPAKR
ncbi:unnamed protein product, partial [Iphiclides podalirius]